jgi:hypothetical protein
MMMTTFRRIVNLISSEKFQFTLKHARGLRDISQQKIDTMQADLNGCDDKFFLMLETPLDQCVPSDEELGLKK